jgi:ribulose-phosphate 3-epimerase
VEAVSELLPVVDFVLLMTVSPGFGGQAFIPQMLSKIRRMRSLAGELPLAVDGGITQERLGEVTAAGAEIIVAGSALFGQEKINWQRWKLYES